MPERHQLIAGNWKMNKTGSEARELVSEIIQKWVKHDKVDVVICPPFTALESCKEVIDQSAEIFLGAQNMHYEPEGAYTGEISAQMLQDLWCKFVILGHSERREYFDESDELVNRKAKAALASSLKPIICVGETLEEREAGKMKSIVVNQVKNSCANIDIDAWKDVVIAYEPVWAIGTGKTATPGQAQEVHALIRQTRQGHDRREDC
jgi:triosephosphate isomerase